MKSLHSTACAVFTMVFLLVTAGCVSYQRKPLDPVAELSALSQVTLPDFIVERSVPGNGPAPDTEPFDPSNGFDEKEVVALALTLNHDVRSKRIEIGEAQAFLIQAGLWPNPELGVGWRAGIGGSTGYTVDADLLFEIVKPWERSTRKDIAATRIEEVRAEIIAEEWKLVSETRTQRLTVLFNEQSLALLDEEVLLRERALDIVKRQREVGDGTELEVSAAELDAAMIRRDRRRIETELASARRELNRLLGLPPKFDLRLAESGKPFSVIVYSELGDEELEQRLLAGRFDLRALEFAYEKVEHQLRLAVHRQYPGVKFGPTFGKELEGGTTFGLGLAIELPLFDQNQGEVAEKENQREHTRAVYVGLLHRLKANAYNTRAKLQMAKFEVDTQEKEVLPLISRNRDLYERAFRARDLSILDWVTAQQRALKARQDYLETLMQYQRSVIELEAATGTPLTRPADVLLDELLNK